MNTKLTSAIFVGALSVFGASAASAVTVQNINWDPNAVNGNPGQPADDFVGKTTYTQWFQTASAENTFSPRLTIDLVNLGALAGSSLTGTGIFAEFNGINSIVGDPSPDTNPADFATNVQLTYGFGGIVVNSVDLTNPAVPVFTLDLSSAWVNIYSDAALNYGNTLPETVDAVDTTYSEPFLKLKIDTLTLNTIVAGSNLFGSVDAYFSVIGGAAASYFDTDNQTNTNGGVSDLFYTSSSQFKNGDNFTTGTAELTGDTRTVPEPSSLALLGLGMMGFSKFSRRKFAA
ncbi:PEP-CTERM sorting domain-containing protein [Methylomonas sp. MED-D]|uniref:PEP-CTERM sorting domain-containing protein n=1 Tax=Methylomonas sp. MED-D TaxID=3418768 RepID=UPI003CFF53CF